MTNFILLCTLESKLFMIKQSDLYSHIKILPSRHVKQTRKCLIICPVYRKAKSRIKNVLKSENIYLYFGTDLPLKTVTANLCVFVFE